MEHGEELAKNTQLGLAPSGNAVVYYKSGSRVQGEAVVVCLVFFYPNNYMLKFSCLQIAVMSLDTWSGIRGANYTCFSHAVVETVCML